MSTIPTVRVYRGDATAVINASDLPAWKKGGWSDQKPAPVPPDKQPEVNKPS